MAKFKRISCLPSYLLACLLLTCVSPLAFGYDMVPAPPQTQALLLKGGTLYTAADGVLINTDLLIEHGKIVAMGKQLAANNAEVIDVSGKHIYPGLIALNTQIGLNEISMVRSTVDSGEIGSFNPEISSATAFNADSEIIPTVRANGITHAHIVPAGNGLVGQSVLVNLDAWTIDDAKVAATGQHLVWPAIDAPAATQEEREKQATELNEQISDIHKNFAASFHYYQAAKAGALAQKQQSYDAMQPLFERRASLFVHADKLNSIESAAALARQYGLKLIIVGGYDAWRAADILNEINASVIYTHMLSMPLRHDDPIDLPYRIPSLLAAANLPFAIGFSGDWDTRNLPFAAAQAISHGLSSELSLQAITVNAAIMLGQQDMGVLAPGYRANLVISKGDIFDPKQHGVEALFIDGRLVDLNNRHKQLYQKYLNR
ncbi:amidohydrolase family protein [Shewanella sp. SNU WT4]|nr:amidohydrolase family protein [Shewanella sp. SNU WT4]